MDVFDAAERYSKENRSMIILAGKDYGSGKHIITGIVITVQGSMC
jgi:hypothetical protein